MKGIGKHPIYKGGVNDATFNREQIEDWWDRHPSANIALVPDVIAGTDIEWMVLDLDQGERIRNRKKVFLDGKADLEALERKYGEEVPMEVIARTGSGGEHVLMLKDHGKLASTLSPAIDIISGTGKYILAAPSNHVSGYDYSWKNDSVGTGPFIDRIGRVLPNIGYAPRWVMEFDPHSDHVSNRSTRDDDSHGMRELLRREGTDLDKAEFEEALDTVPNDDVPYDEYFAMLCALHHEAASHDDLDWGFKIALAWAERSSKFIHEDFEHRWNSIRDEGNTKTGKYVLMLARQHGWVVPERGPIGEAVRELNKKHAMVLNAGRGMIVTTDNNEKGEEVLSFTDPGKLAPWYANKRVEVPDPIPSDPTRTKLVPKDKLWLVSERRKEYFKMVFDPRGNEPGVLNLWRGFAFTPSKHKNPYQHCYRWVDHIYDVICSGNKEHGDWVIGFWAQMFQRPEEKIGTSLVMLGEMGTGKSVVGMHVGKLIPQHTSVVDKSEQIVGKFNVHLTRCLLLLAEEAFWAGDRSAEGSLKHLVTSDTLTIEPKGVDPYTVANYTRLVVTSNSAWAVPAGMDERRFATFRVSNDRKRDQAYFAAMAHQMENGGYEALLQYFLEFDLSKVDLRTIPKTDALLDQKISTADGHVKWVMEMLITGTPWWGPAGDVLGRADPEEFYNAYLSYCKDNRCRAIDARFFGKEMHRLLLGFEKFRPKEQGGIRRYRYGFDLLSRCRDHFERIIGHEINWDH